jgi:hypothetical protein
MGHPRRHSRARQIDGTGAWPDGGRELETYFRLYGPTQSYFGKIWVLPDLEEGMDGNSIDLLIHCHFRQNMWVGWASNPQPTPKALAFSGLLE